ncbi:AAA family ATPase [Candidatus Woesearchaeota archaeon]|nr:AAA family ATPase [Candidatus Woesearchaeota archaeon]
MPDLFRDILKSSESLFKNEVALDPEFVPKLIQFRENENQYIATCIKPLFQKRNGKNLIIHGPPGVGKTLATKNVLKELEEETDDITPVYVNCWKKNTTYQVVLELCKAIDYKFIQNKRTDELISIIVERLNKKSSVLVFDEIDKIQELDILYNLSESLYRKTIILLTNESNWLFRLDSRLKSRLIPDQLEFKPYSLTETKEILKQRISQAFPPNTINENSLNKITENTFKQRDIRTGLFLLKESAEIAESNSSKKIEMQHVEEAVKRVIFSDTEKLDEEEKQVLEFIKTNMEKTTGEMAKLYEETHKKSKRTFQRKLNNLQKSNLIKLDETESPRGRSFRVKPLTEF